MEADRVTLGTEATRAFPHWESPCGAVLLVNGDCRQVLTTLTGAACVVTDPPYELGFMGRQWDRSGVAFDPATWAKVADACLPGAHLLAFGGTRTWHRMAVAIEDAGWEIRDTIGWLHGQGFPKNHDVSKAIDREAGAEREVIGRGACGETAISDKAGEVVGYRPKAYHEGRTGFDITAPATDAARQWAGWGTALKPAHEPIIVARKPLDGTVAANVLKHGTGGLNIDGCRIAHDEPQKTTRRKFTSGQLSRGTNDGRDMEQWERSHSGEGLELPASASPAGRWPANVIHDGSEEVVGLFPVTTSGAMKPTHTTAARKVFGQNAEGGYTTMETYGDTGSAARFFYCAKASKSDRGEGNSHPTVKPTDLMRYLCRLVTPPGGIILDPFAGSGSTLKAAILEGFHAIGIEEDANHFDIASERLRAEFERLPLF